jgi:hypothetical protein
MFGSPHNHKRRTINFKYRLSDIITRMLHYDERVITFAFEGQTLTDCASKRRALDLWILSLERPGYQSFTIINPDLWASVAHLYDPPGFVSHFTEGLGRISTDPTSGRMCLVISALDG